MENHDPYALIEATAAGLRRRRLASFALPGLPPTLVVAVFAALGRLPVELAAAWVIAAGALALHLSGPGPDSRRAATRLDERTAGQDHFLTLATSELRPPMREIVESGAVRLGEGLRPVDLAPPLAWRGLAQGTLAAAILAGLLLLAPERFPSAPEPAARLEWIAAELERSGDESDAALARELRTLAETLRDLEASPEERRQAAEETLGRVKQQEPQQGAKGSDGGGGQQAGTEGSGTGELRGEARSALEEISESRGEQSGTGETGEQKSGESEGEGSQQGESGGGVNAPQPDSSGTKEREGEGEQNRPDESSNAKSRESEGGAGEGREPRDPDRPGAGEAKGPDPSGGAGGGGASPSPSTPEGPENPDLSGDGSGWRIVDGRYVRIRVPEGENDLLETERVRRPGEIAPETPYGNAPLPGSGPAGSVEERQPLPLEYRDVLTGTKGGRTR